MNSYNYKNIENTECSSNVQKASAYRILNDVTPIHSNLSSGIAIDRLFLILENKFKASLKRHVDSAIYVMSADCGTGKGLVVEKVLRDWKKEGFPGQGVIIFVSTLEEIDRFIHGAGLEKSDYAVCSPDEKYSRYGSGLHAINSVPVLFVTHSKAKKVLRPLPNFEDAAEFLLNDKPRALRIWDEAYHAAAGASFTLPELWELPKALERLGKQYSRLLSALIKDVKETDGSTLLIPNAVADVAEALFQSKLPVSDSARRTLGELAKLAGSTAFVRMYGENECRFIGKGRPFPANMGPLFVLDASARFTDRYNRLPAYGMKVVHLDPATVAYGQLAIHWCDMSAGKIAMRNKADREVIFGIIANLVNSKATETFLVIMAKEFCRVMKDEGVTLHDDLAALLNDPGQLRLTNWGRHRGTNEFRDIPNVIIVGDHRYPHEAYDPLALAANGNNRGLVSKEQHDAQIDETFMDNIYQAVCRCRVRQRDAGNSGTANAYLIMTDSDRQRRLVKRAFPACNIAEWYPVAPKKKSKLQLAVSTLEILMQGRTMVSKREFTDACGGMRKQDLNRLLNDQRFKDAIRNMGITVRRSDFIRSGILKMVA